MARTIAHRPRDTVKSGTEVELERHNARDSEVQVESRRLNRRGRRTARTQIATARYDDLETQGTGRHRGLWNAS